MATGASNRQRGRLPTTLAALRSFTPIVFVVAAPVVTAQGPLTIEQLIVDESSWQLNATTRFAARPILGSHEEQSSASFGLRHGLTPRLELNAQVRQGHVALNSGLGESASSNSAMDFGVNMQLLQESAYPALLLEYRATLFDDRADDAVGLATQELVITSYKTIDPLVLSVTAGVRQHSNYSSDSRRIQQGDQLRLEGFVNFAVNPRVTLLAGAALAHRDMLRIGGEAIVPAETQVSLRGGAGIAMSTAQTLFVLADGGSDGGAGVAINWLYSF